MLTFTKAFFKAVWWTVSDWFCARWRPIRNKLRTWWWVYICPPHDEDLPW